MELSWTIAKHTGEKSRPMSIIDISGLPQERNDRADNHVSGVLNCHLHGLIGYPELGEITLEQCLVLLSQNNNDAAKHLMFSIVGALKTIGREAQQKGLPNPKAANQTPEAYSFNRIINVINKTFLHDPAYPEAKAESFFQLDNAIRKTTFGLDRNNSDDALSPSDAAGEAFHRLLSAVAMNLQRKRESAEHELSRIRGS